MLDLISRRPVTVFRMMLNVCVRRSMTKLTSRFVVTEIGVTRLVGVISVLLRQSLDRLLTY